MDAHEKRIHAILGDDNERTMQNASRYRTHLLKHLSLPLLVTGIEDFPWEERYVMGGRYVSIPLRQLFCEFSVASPALVRYTPSPRLTRFVVIG